MCVCIYFARVPSHLLSFISRSVFAGAPTHGRGTEVAHANFGESVLVQLQGLEERKRERATERRREHERAQQTTCRKYVPARLSKSVKK